MYNSDRGGNVRIAIVDDQQESLNLLRNHINSYADHHNIPMIIDEFNDGIHIINDYRCIYDIIYLDIQMKTLNGLETARAIREHDPKVIIVFVTNYVQWAIEGYSVNATDFLLKPVTTFSFEEHFKRVLKIVTKQEDKSISIKTNDGIIRMPLNTLLFVESDGHYLNFYTHSSSFTTLDTMKNIEVELEDFDFYRCNNGYIVNMKYIDSIEDSTIFIKGHKLQISRPRRKAFLDAFTKYIGTPWR